MRGGEAHAILTPARTLTLLTAPKPHQGRHASDAGHDAVKLLDLHIRDFQVSVRVRVRVKVGVRVRVRVRAGVGARARVRVRVSDAVKLHIRDFQARFEQTRRERKHIFAWLKDASVRG